MTFEAIHTVVRRTAHEHPDRIAVHTEQGTLTYTQLLAAADRVTADLHAAGVGPTTLVPILADDRREVIAALLGVLQAGAVVVPVDPATPRLRLAEQLATVAPQCVLTGTGGDELAGAGLARVPIRLTGPDVTIEPHASEPDDPCYVFFTSGSTGSPKGIVGRLSGVDHYIRWEIDLLGVRPGWRVSQLTSQAFDAVLRDVFVPLCAGGTVYVPPAAIRKDPNELSRWLDEQRIDLVHCVPSVFRRIVDSTIAEELEFPALKAIAMAGEKLAPEDAGAWFDQYGERVRLLNLYGPSETTMTKTYHFVTQADTERASIPIGRPMPGTTVLVLDGGNRPCAPGEVGEIVLSTPFRSLGYHQDPELTARVFVPNPLTGDPADIVYRTGDYGRVLPGGELEFIGRRDHQVKIGGVRVELGEVESALRTHPAISDAAVVVTRDDADELAYLCAFVELSGTLEPDEARTYLAARLAETAIPSVFVPLPELPRTISGKIDRRALPAPVLPDKRLADHVAARTPVEKALVDLWVEVLPVADIGVRHRFFDVGGQSLMVMRLLNRIREQFGVPITLQDFLAAPVIEALAELIEAAIADERQPDDLLADIPATGHLEGN